MDHWHLPIAQLCSITGIIYKRYSWNTSGFYNSAFAPCMTHVAQINVSRTNNLYPKYILICRRTQNVAGYKLLVRDTCWLYLGDIITIHLCDGQLVSLCIQQQTGDKLATILSWRSLVETASSLADMPWIMMMMTTTKYNHISHNFVKL